MCLFILLSFIFVLLVLEDVPPLFIFISWTQLLLINWSFCMLGRPANVFLSCSGVQHSQNVEILPKSTVIPLNRETEAAVFSLFFYCLPPSLSWFSVTCIISFLSSLNFPSSLPRLSPCFSLSDPFPSSLSLSLCFFFSVCRARGLQPVHLPPPSGVWGWRADADVPAFR